MKYVNPYKSKKGFTLVEIMIVVVIIGLLAALAIPAFLSVRARSVAGTMDNDARQIGAAAQQHFLEESAITVDIEDLVHTVTIGTVENVGENTDPYHISQLSRGVFVVAGENTIAMRTANVGVKAFVLDHAFANAPREYDDEGRFLNEVAAQ